jgi:hypothetical protein
MIESITKEMKTIIISLILLLLGCNPTTSTPTDNEPIGPYHIGDAGTATIVTPGTWVMESGQLVESDPQCEHYYVHRAWVIPDDSMRYKLYSHSEDGRECICIKCQTKNICY